MRRTFLREADGAVWHGSRSPSSCFTAITAPKARSPGDPGVLDVGVRRYNALRRSRAPQLFAKVWRKFRYPIDSNIAVQAFRGDKEQLRGGLTFEFDQAKRLSDFVDLVARLVVCLFGARYFYHLSQNATTPLDKLSLFPAALISFAIFLLLGYRVVRIITIYDLIGPSGPATGWVEKIIRVMLLVFSILLTIAAARALVLVSFRLVDDNSLLK